MHAEPQAAAAAGEASGGGEQAQPQALGFRISRRA
jgi:hypothetical protein